MANVTTDESGEAVFTDVSRSENFDIETWKDGAGFYRSVIAAAAEE